MAGKRCIRIDGVIAAISERQYGVVSRVQLEREAEVTASTIDWRVQRGLLVPLHRGVYAVGDRALPASAHLMAATLACGPGSAASHRAAGAWWGMRHWGGTPEVTTRTRRRPRSGIITHCEVLPSDEVTVHEGIAVTTPSRTAFDLAATLDLARLRRILNDPAAQQLSFTPPLAVLLERHPGRPGTANLRHLLEEGLIGLEVTQSDYEAEVLQAIKDYGLPAPLVNTTITIGDERFEVDLAWPRQGLIVELDGAAFHNDPASVERDKRRDRRLQAAGHRVVRIAYRQFRAERLQVMADLAAALRLPVLGPVSR